MVEVSVVIAHGGVRLTSGLRESFSSVYVCVVHFILVGHGACESIQNLALVHYLGFPVSNVSSFAHMALVPEVILSDSVFISPVFFEGASETMRVLIESLIDRYGVVG